QHVLGLTIDWAELTAEVERWQSLHDEAVAEDPQATAYVALLERQFDHRTEATLAAAEDLGTQFEAFLKDLDP
ncbi:MAG TPA: hypothetical protein PLV68_09570, partial [Ilumatobacteraceae bacterium]|nr:hypothetical protein [Ilumatobacteraceae bacterium]